MARHARRAGAPDPRTVRPAVPLAVELALLRALAKAPAERFATDMAEFTEALREPSAPEVAVAPAGGDNRRP